LRLSRFPQNALTNLQASVQRVRDIAASIDANAQAALADSAIQARHETTLCAATVILSGFLESFLREVAEEMAAEISRCAIPFHTLPQSVRVTHFLDGGNCLRQTAQHDKREDPLLLAKAVDVARRLASVGSQGPYEVLWEAFSDTGANPGPDQVGKFLKRFGVEKPLPTLASAMSTTENTLTLRLRSFMGIRNECAHTGVAKNVPTTTDSQAFCDLIEQMASGIVTVLQAALRNPPYTPGPASQVESPQSMGQSS
jgi:hypothetical protein